MALPSDLTTITVTGTYLTVTGTPLTGQVNFSLTTPVEDSTGKVIFNAFTQPVSLVNGSISIVLPCTDNADLNPVNFTYLVTEVIQGLGRAYYIQLPHTLGSMVDLSQLAPVSPPPAASAFASSNTWTGTQTFSGNLPLKISHGAASGYVLTSDSAGDASWQSLGSATLTGATPLGYIVPAPTGVAATDSANIRAALTAAGNAGGGNVILQSGSYIGDTSQFAIPQNVTVIMQQNTTWNINCTAGSAVDAITVAEGAAITGQSDSVIVGTAMLNARTLISNATHTIQEVFILDGFAIALNGGATLAVAVVEMVGCYVPSGVSGCYLNLNGVNTGVPGIRIAGGGEMFGPVFISNTVVTGSGGDCIYITDAGNSIGVGVLWMDNVTAQHPAQGYHNIHFSGSNGLLVASHLNGIHCENDVATPSGTVAALYIDGASNVTVTDLEVLATSVTNKVPVYITNNAYNGQIKITGLLNNNNMTPVIVDATVGLNISPGGGNLYEYNGPGFTAPLEGAIWMYGGSFSPAVVTLTDASVVTVNAILGNDFRLLMTSGVGSTRELGTPSHPWDGQRIVFQVTQDGSGSQVLTYTSAYDFGAAGTPTLSTGGNATDILQFTYNASKSKWLFTGAVLGF